MAAACAAPSRSRSWSGSRRFSAQLGKEVRLGNHFDLVGGTSTGAIIAGALALGYRAAEVRELYTKLAPLAFKRQKWTIPILHAKFDVRGLRAEIEKIVGDLELQSEKLITGLCVVTKRIDTGSPWILANNPRAPYWEDGEGHDGNKHYKLATLVRASTAAPHFFDPELIPINSRKSQLPQTTAAPLDKPLLTRFRTGHPRAPAPARKAGAGHDRLRSVHRRRRDAAQQPVVRAAADDDAQAISALLAAGTGQSLGHVDRHRHVPPPHQIPGFGLHALSAARLSRADVAHDRHRNDGARADAVAGRMLDAVGDQLRDRHAGRRRAARRQAVSIPALRRAPRAGMAYDELGVAVAENDIARYRCMDDPTIVSTSTSSPGGPPRSR